MNVLFVIDSLGSGGAQRQLVNLGVGFKRRGFDVTFLYYYDEDFYLEYLIDNEIIVKYLQCGNIYNRFTNVRTFIRNGKYDIVIAFLGIPSLLAAFSALPYKRWMLITGERSSNPLLLSSLKRRVTTISHLFSDFLVSNSHTNIEIVLKANPLISKNKCKVIYNAVDLNKFSPDINYRFLNQNILKLTVAASYRKLKNLIGLIEAINMLKPKEKERLEVNWYGDTSFNSRNDKTYDEAIDLIEKYRLNKIIYLNGQKKDIEVVMRASDLIGLFSFHEGFPNVVCEGMACGKPILASAVSDLPHIIEDNVNGKLCDPNNIASIVYAIKYFLYCKPSELKQMGESNRNKAVELFNMEKNINKYISLLK